MSFPNEVYNSIISAIGVIISAVISLLISKKTASVEIKKIQMRWEYQKTLDSENAFSKAIGDVTWFVAEPSSQSLFDAIHSLNIVRTQSQGEVSKTLDDINDVFLNIKNGGYNKEKLQRLLSKAVEEKRECSG